MSVKPVVPVSGPVPPPTAPLKPLVLEAYDVSKCDRACPLCDKEFPDVAVVDARKQLYKHVKDHRPDPANLRFKSWLQAANRFGAAFVYQLPATV